MSVLTCLQPRNSDVITRAISYIGLQKTRGGPFEVDETIANLARRVFHENLCKNRIVSTAASLLGGVGVIGSGVAVVMVFYSFPCALCVAAVSIVCFKLFADLRNREGYRLHEALVSGSQEEQIRQLSLGSNIYQSIWPYGGAAPRFMQFVKGGPRTLCQWLAGAGKYESLAYALMLEEDLTKRAELATQAIPEAKNIEIAQLLLDFGARLENGEIFYFCCLSKNLELVNFFVTKGARINAGINDYEQWQRDVDHREIEYGGNWFPPNSDGVSPTLHPRFRTPLETLVEPDVGPNGRIASPSTENPRLALQALGIDSTVYTDKETAEDLFHALNRVGARIRLEWARKIFIKLNAE